MSEAEVKELEAELAAIVAKQMVSLVAPYGELALLFAIYAVAMVVGAVITNNAVVTLMFPVVVRMCEGAGVPWRPRQCPRRRSSE